MPNTAPCVLLVENNKPNQLVSSTIIEMLGYDYDIATNGEEAVKLAQKGRYDSILMDLEMPVMSGYEATKLIRDQEERKNKPPVPIIAVTAHAFSRDKEKCFEMGMDDYICKPFKVGELESKLISWVQRKQATQVA